MITRKTLIEAICILGLVLGGPVGLAVAQEGGVSRTWTAVNGIGCSTDAQCSGECQRCDGFVCVDDQALCTDCQNCVNGMILLAIAARQTGNQEDYEEAMERMEGRSVDLAILTAGEATGTD